jgi:hydroxymethylbilane synthase
MMRKIIVGSRQSALALTQTHWVIDQLQQLGLPFTFEVKKILTKGDQILDVTLSKVGGKGLFVKEIELALMGGEIDMAVHSMKDMPAQFPEELVVAAIPKRVDPRDCLISRNGLSLAELPQGARIGTSSLRRNAQILHARPDLQVEPIRGNIDTRLKKLENEGFDAILLAAAGLTRMGWEDRITENLDVDTCIPAVGQGALGIQCRADDQVMIDLLRHLDDEATRRTVTAERAFLQTFNGGCQIPIGAYATIEGNDLHMSGMVGSADAKQLLVERMEGTDAETLGRALAHKLIERGADKLLDEIRQEIEQ